MDFRPNVRRLAFALLCGFLLVLLRLTYLQVFVAPRLQASPYNERDKARRAATRRGSVFDRNDRVLARTQDLGEGVTQRMYPLDEAAAHVVGYSTRLYGQDGIERTQDDALIAAGPYATSFKRLLSPRGVGCDVTLTLDAEAQRAVYTELALRRGAAIALDVRTGEVLLMVSAPSFSPALLDEQWEDIRQRGDGALLNRATARRYPLGAAMQLIVATAAIDSGVAQPTDTFTCPGSADVGGVRVACARRRGHGQVDLSTALALPCRTTFAKLADRVGADTLDLYIERFGLADAPDIELAARRSIVPRLSARGTSDFMAACFEDNGVQVTPLAMCSAVASLADGGTRMRPHLVASVSNANGRVLDKTVPRAVGVVCSPSTAAEMAELMASAVQRGTAERAGIPDVKVAGIAGSSPQSDDDGWTVWFIGFAPADRPQVAVCVVIEEGSRSGQQATELGMSVLQALLR